MLRITVITIIFCIAFLTIGCEGKSQNEVDGTDKNISKPIVKEDNKSINPEGNLTALTAWQKVKENASVNVVLTQVFKTPQILSIATLGWEDGINVSRDGLHLYATYIPADFLSFVLSQRSVAFIVAYDRGPHYDMDFVSNPVGLNYPWYQSDIIYASRATTNVPFSAWYTSSLKRSIYSEGAISAVFSDASHISMAVFTSNDVYTAQNNIKMVNHTTVNPMGVGTLITTIDTTDCGSIGDTSINTNCIEDNPHLEDLGSNKWVLFFDSEDRPGGDGGHDLWYATSDDNGSTWSHAVAVSSLNTSAKEHQPHLYNDGTSWWLYYSAYHTDHKLAIYRAKQTVLDDWNSWDVPEVVITAGNTEGIGEATLTESGDLYFVAIVKNDTNDTTDLYDADPWVALHQ